MHTPLVTGATSFLGHHVVKRLNASGVRPRVLERRGAKMETLDSLDVERAAGHLEEASSVQAACGGVDHVLHLAYKVSVGGGAGLLDEMRRVNVAGTTELLRSAAAAGVRRAVVVGSALAVGVNREPTPLDERATWSQHAFDLPYATIRRDAEIAALAEARPGFDVVSVCPAFTFGPDDPVGAPANKLLERLVTGKLPVSLPVAFSCTDVRDFADGMVRAAERGRSGERYLLTGENVTADQLLQRAAQNCGSSGTAVEAADVPRARGDRRAGTRQPAARTAGAGHTRGAAGFRALRVVRRHQGANRARLDATAAGPDARRHHRVAAHARPLTTILWLTRCRGRETTQCGYC